MMEFKKIYEAAKKLLPYKLIKRINKTGEGRSGDEIYKRRNRRTYRGLMQYVTWDSLTKNNPKLLNEYKEGYIVWISPKEYFGDNYPNVSDTVNKNFILGKNGFIYYKSPEELIDFPPLDNWTELYELSTNGSSQKSWIGEVCFNIKNAGQQKISAICADRNAKLTKKDIKAYLENAGVDLSIYKNIPDQCGIGNYDYDYANQEMINDVKAQMLYLALTCEDQQGMKFGEYLLKNHDRLIENEKDSAFSKSVKEKDYLDKYKSFMKNLKEYCSLNNLLNFDDLAKINAWDPVNKRPICPLCSKPLTADDFFKEVIQQQGRQVFDNTQREIVLMHVRALRPGYLNHKTYNLAWGHFYCNTIQGDKDICETIESLKEIIENYERHLNENNK